MSDPAPRIEELYAIDLLMNVPDKKKKKDIPSPSNTVDTSQPIDEFRTMMRQRIEVFQSTNKPIDAIDQLIYGIWLYYVHGSK